MSQILTTQAYWHSVSNSVKAYWRNVAKKTNMVVCTGRPNARKFRGTTTVRRKSTGGKWGKSVDEKHLDVKKLLNAGYTLLTIN